MQLTGARLKVRKSLRSQNNQISDSGTLWMTTGVQFGFGWDWVYSAVRPPIRVMRKSSNLNTCCCGVWDELFIGLNISCVGLVFRFRKME
ncbi:hypothetical protein AVEN_4494-1 [Araneus ventricosus]|uniref:Uncharacterized protein n=1 Tax=Araneus ventricosus TaxID=182803 RepID=A0A4Y2BKN4_ARAVE|nr:hypothetical protein AVEN_4494-1 [Araneus ventricosus]